MCASVCVAFSRLFLHFLFWFFYLNFHSRHTEAIEMWNRWVWMWKIMSLSEEPHHIQVRSWLVVFWRDQTIHYDVSVEYIVHTQHTMRTYMPESNQLNCDETANCTLVLSRCLGFSLSLRIDYADWLGCVVEDLCYKFWWYSQVAQTRRCHNFSIKSFCIEIQIYCIPSNRSETK